MSARCEENGTVDPPVQAGRRSKTKLVSTAAATILAALITATAMLLAHGDTGSGNNQIHGNNGPNCINSGNQGIQNCVGSPNEHRSDGRATADPPSGRPPWTFYVYDTVADGTDLGLTVRSCNIQSCGCITRNCSTLGFARDGAPLYAFCQLDTKFNGADNSTIWLKVAWPNNKGGDPNVYVSSPQDPYTGWVLKKYTTPGGHNGNIPQCHGTVA